MTSSQLEFHGLSDIGNKRLKNEDHFLIAELVKGLTVRQTNLSSAAREDLPAPEQGLLAIVADGMGGHAGGHEASSIALRAIGHHVVHAMPWFYSETRDGHEGLVKMSAAFRTAERLTREEAEVHPEFGHMGTTVTVACIVWPKLFVAHAGDSRCYVQHEQNLRQLTHDHTLAQELVDAGAMTPEDAQGSRLSHALSNAVTADPEDRVRPEVVSATLHSRDSVLLCTDGLVRYVSDEEIGEALRGATHAEDTCKSLVGLAKKRGGDDNITAVVIRVA